MDQDSGRAPRWLAAAFALLAMLAGLAVSAWSFELPYFAMSAGPVSDIFDAIEVEDGVTFYDPEGELLMLTVAVQGINAYELVAAAVDPTVDVLRQERLRDPDETDDEYRRRGLAQMDSSKENAIAVAIERLDGDVVLSSDGVEVVAVIEGAPAAAVLRTGDRITAVDGLEVVVAQDIGEALADRSPGDVAKVVVIRSGTELTLDVELTSDPDDPAQVRVGIQARTVNPEFPVDIDSENVGGPSAGMMYTLGIIDLLSPGDLTAGHVVAGTGTIAADGSVGGIGGIRQKVVAAEAAGAEVILVPESNYEEALTAPAGELEIVPVATVDDALAYLAGLE